MELVNHAVAGTLESGDILIEIEPSRSGGLFIELDSAVACQFGQQIRKVIEQTASDCSVEHAKIRALDKGALDCTIRARVQAAICRSSGKTFDFSKG